MGEIVFVGLGLHDEMGISLQGLEEAKTADQVFIELYTSLLPEFQAERLEQLCGKSLTLVSRRDLEENNGRIILNTAKAGKVVLLVPGDPLIATTHVALRIQAEKESIITRTVHGASILSAVIGLSGLHNYKFGKSVTIPFSEDTSSRTPYETIAQNKRLGLHTLCLLDMKAEEKRYMTIREALDSLLKTERESRREVMTRDTLALGIARAGSHKPTVKADSAGKLLTYDFGSPPYSLVFPGKLHFLEAEALVILTSAPKELCEASG